MFRPFHYRLLMKTGYVLVIVCLLILSACVPGAAVNRDAAQSTAVYHTVQALQGQPNVKAALETAVMQTVQAAQGGMSTDRQQAVYQTVQAAQVATQVAILQKTQPAPGNQAVMVPANATVKPPSLLGNQPVNNPNSPISIKTIGAFPGTVYYGTCTNNEFTALSLQTNIEPVASVSGVSLYYYYISTANKQNMFSMQMKKLGNNSYAADIMTGSDPAKVLGTDNGGISFWIEALDTKGYVTKSKEYSIPLYKCTSAAMGAIVPGQNPAGNPGIGNLLPGNQPAANPGIGNLLPANQPAVNPGIGNLLPANQPAANPGMGNLLPANQPAANPGIGNLLPANQPAANPVNPPVANPVNPPVANPPAVNPGNIGGANYNATIVNNSGHPMISLEIDGFEQFPQEPMGIDTGKSWAVTLISGTHSIKSWNGWWENGLRETLYSKSGTISEQNPSFTFPTPTAYFLLSNNKDECYSTQGLPVVMGSDGGFYVSAFRFTSNGNFTEYKNGNPIDQGTYKLESYNTNFTADIRLTSNSGVTALAYYWELGGSFQIQGVAELNGISYTPGCP